MKHLAKLNLAQRIVIIIALGIAIVFFGEWVTSLGTPLFGLGAYAPLTASIFWHRGRLTFGEITLIWIGLTALWAAVSMVVLRSPKAE